MGIETEEIGEETILDRYNNNDFYSRSEQTAFQILDKLTCRKELEQHWEEIEDDIRIDIINKSVKVVEENHG